MSQEVSVTQEFSAGGIVFRVDTDGIKIAAIYREFHRDWTLPKGHIEAGETAEQAAVREVKEEIGVDARIIRHIGHSVYNFKNQENQPIEKRVEYFLMEALSDSTGVQLEEVDKMEWLPFMRAITQLTFSRDQDLVKQSVAEISHYTRPQEKAS